MKTLAALCFLFAACGSSGGSGGSGGGGAGGAGGSGGTGGAAGTCNTGFANCTTYDDHTAASDARAIAFTFSQYTPKCMKIKAGQMVTFSGDFASHPLAQSCGAAPVIVDGTGTSKSFTFATAGDYGYYCQIHGTAAGTGMAGSIQVVP